jgi:hypothetical protein
MSGTHHSVGSLPYRAFKDAGKSGAAAGCGGWVTSHGLNKQRPIGDA